MFLDKDNKNVSKVFRNILTPGATILPKSVILDFFIRTHTIMLIIHAGEIIRSLVANHLRQFVEVSFIAFPDNLSGF